MQNPLLSNDVDQLLRVKTEGKNLDYKQGLDWATCSNDEKIEIVKDILAMSNTQDGGRIIFGVRDNDFEPLGVSDEEFASFDQTKVNDFLHKYTDPKFTCYVYKQTVDKKKFVVIDVPEFPESPIICKQDANSSKEGKSILRRGQLYMRTEKATSEPPSSAQDMRELLGRALAKRSDELLGNIERLLKGRPPKATESAEEKYREEIREADGFFEETIGEELKKFGSWTLNVYPTDYSPKRILDHQRIKELIRSSEVQLRGWNFPIRTRKATSPTSQEEDNLTQSGTGI
jgi:Putative DNA-binding domain